MQGWHGNIRSAQYPSGNMYMLNHFATSFNSCQTQLIRLLLTVLSWESKLKESGTKV